MRRKAKEPVKPRTAQMFPDLEEDIREDRTASRRERVQHARAYLKSRNLSWLINYLLEKGPMSEHAILIDAADEEYFAKGVGLRVVEVLRDLNALWLIRKLWRRDNGIHPCSGQQSHIYGIRGVHHQPTVEQFEVRK